MKIIDKPWGNEIWLVNNNKYVAKILNINADERTSLQYHSTKDETLYLDEGIANVTIDENSFDIGSGAILEISPGTIHRIEAITDCKFFEVSTPELEDVIRVEDDYDRM